MSLSEFYAHEPHEDSPILSVGFVDSPPEFTSPSRRPTPTPSITDTAHDAHTTVRCISMCVDGFLIFPGDQSTMPIAAEPIYATPADTIPSRSHSTTESIRSTTRIPSRPNFFLPEALPTDLDRVPSPSVAFSHSPRGRPEASTSSNSIPSDIKEPSIPSSTSRLGSPISFDMDRHSPKSSHGRRGQPSFSPPTADISPVDSPQNPSLQNVRSSLSRRSSASRPRAKSGSEVKVRSRRALHHLVSHIIFNLSQRYRLSHLSPHFPQVLPQQLISLVRLPHSHIRDPLHPRRLDHTCSLLWPRTLRNRCQSC
jgi:hypothetical protein